MTEFKIEKGVPLLPKGRNSDRPRKYPFPDLAVGDSFFVPANEKGRSKLQRELSTEGARQARNHRGKFATRREGGGIRVWRIE